MRAKKLRPLTRSALALVANEAAKAGLLLPDAVEISAANSWAGFKQQWLEKPDTIRPPKAAGNRQQQLEERNRAVASKWQPNEEPV